MVLRGRPAHGGLKARKARLVSLVYAAHREKPARRAHPARSVHKGRPVHRAPRERKDRAAHRDLLASLVKLARRALRVPGGKQDPRETLGPRAPQARKVKLVPRVLTARRVKLVR